MTTYGMHTYQLGAVRRFMDTGKYPEINTYARIYGMPDAPNLYSVESNVSGIPNFMTWYPDNGPARDTPLTSKLIIDLVSPYMANMVDEELAFFKPILIQLTVIYGITQIDFTSNSICLYTTINGEPKMLLVSVMNMIDILDNVDEWAHHWHRKTLN